MLKSQGFPGVHFLAYRFTCLIDTHNLWFTAKSSDYEGSISAPMGLVVDVSLEVFWWNVPNDMII